MQKITIFKAWRGVMRNKNAKMTLEINQILVEVPTYLTNTQFNLKILLTDNRNENSIKQIFSSQTI